MSKINLKLIVLLLSQNIYPSVNVQSSLFWFLPSLGFSSLAATYHLIFSMLSPCKMLHISSWWQASLSLSNVFFSTTLWSHHHLCPPFSFLCASLCLLVRWSIIQSHARLAFAMTTVKSLFSSKKWGKKQNPVTSQCFQSWNSCFHSSSAGPDDYSPFFGHDIELFTEKLQLPARCCYHFPHIRLILFVLCLETG